MKYFNPSYWFKLWVLSAPLFNDKTQGINAKSIDNQNIKDWANKNTSLESINQEISFTNSSTNYQSYSLNQITNQNINPIYQKELETSTHKHRHEKSRRIKKQVTPHPNSSRKILTLSKELIINENNFEEYRSSFLNIIRNLLENNILNEVGTLDTSDIDDGRLFILNTENYGYFRLPINIRAIDRQTQQSYPRSLELVLRTDNLYVQGIIVNNYYYHFDFNLIDATRQPQAVRDGLVPLLTRIEGIQSRRLTGISPDYRDLYIGAGSGRIYRNDIIRSFVHLSNIEQIYNPNTNSWTTSIGHALGHAILFTAEALRFRSIYNTIIYNLITTNNQQYQYIVWERDAQENNIHRVLMNWGTNSRNLARVINEENIFNENNILNIPIDEWTWELRTNTIRILLASVFIRTLNCNRGKRELKEDDWHKKICDLKPQIDKIQGKITVIKVLENNDIYVGTKINDNKGNLYKISNNSNNLDVEIFNNWNENHGPIYSLLINENQIYVGTKNGVYYNFLHNHRFTNFDGLKFPIISIKLDNNANVYATNDKSETYHLNSNNFGSSYVPNYISTPGWMEAWNCFWCSKRIEIIFSPHNVKEIIKSFTYNNEEVFINSLITDLLKKLLLLGDLKHIPLENQEFINIAKTIWQHSAEFREKNKTNINWLRIKTNVNGDLNEIKITDYNGARKRRNIIFDNVKITEFVNSTKWTNDFTKSINNEQHLSIDNKTNFVTNNITSL